MLGAFLILLLLLASPAAATTFYTGTGGNDANTCTQAQTESTRKLTVAAGVGCLSSGDTLTVTAGTYVGQVNLDNIPNGPGSGSYTIFQGVGDTTIFQTTNDHTLRMAGTKSWIKFLDFKLNGHAMTSGGANSITLDTATATNLWFQRVNCYGGRNTCISNNMGTTNITLKDMVLAEVGTSPSVCNTNPGEGYCHGMYFNAGDSLIENVIAYNNDGNGFQVYGEVATSDNIIMRNSIAYGNLTWGVITGAGMTNIKIYNNTIYNNGAEGIRLQNAAQEAKNNIVLGHSETQINCGTATCSSNTTTGTPTDIWVNPATADFHLKAGSAAIGAGADLGAAVPTDKDGLSRPQGGTWDIGAYEYTGDIIPPGGRGIASNRGLAVGRSIASNRGLATSREAAQ